jgi:hypothetical protein
MGRSTTMGRGPYEKSGLVSDTSLPPGRTVEERFEVPFPATVAKVGGKDETQVTDDTLEITVELWYLPYGTRDTTPFKWREAKRTVRLVPFE